MNKTKMSRLLPSLALLWIVATVPAWATTLLGPSPYSGFGDSPFNAGSFSYFYLETFESGALGVPGVATSGGTILGPSRFADSVDADDGVIDGLGNNGHSWYSAGNRSLSFTFSAAILGALPTYVGIVWTDVGFKDDGVLGPAPVLFEAFDSLNHSLGLIGPSPLGDESVYGTTGEDRFFGIFDHAGISRITIAMPTSGDWEVDHLQYGYGTEDGVIGLPEPNSLLLTFLGLATVWSVTRKSPRPRLQRY
jgi:hypothetical protein